jgi:hypothetical protein
MCWACGMTEMKQAYIIFIGKSLGKLLLSRPRRWNGNNKMDLTEVGYDF